MVTWDTPSSREERRRGESHTCETVGKFDVSVRMRDFLRSFARTDEETGLGDFVSSAVRSFRFLKTTGFDEPDFGGLLK
jgi:hypothetical protein